MDELTETLQRVALLERDYHALKEKIGNTEGIVMALQLRDATNEVHNQGVTSRLDKIESTLVWTNRIIVGGFLLALVSFVVSGGIAL